MGQTHDEAYPLMPHKPVVVGAASCEDVVLRWRSVENDAAWPIHGYVLQRFPDAAHKLEWETLVESTNASESTDRNVRISHQYLYRVQAISGAARSSFAYHAVSMNQSTCHRPTSLAAYLPSAFHVIPFIDMLSVEAVQTFVLIISCFLAVFGVMRSNVKRVQRTRSRQGRLRKMEKQTLAETSASKLYTLPRLSSSDISTEPSTSAADFQQSSRSSQFETLGSSGVFNSTTTSRATEPATRADFAPRAASFSAPLDKSTCQYCHKKFGIFRRRRVCDVCEAVVLCRKCGVQAPRDATVEGLRDSLSTRNLLLESDRPRVTKSSSVRARRPKTICRDCCADRMTVSTRRGS